jgi:hypothetical protein
MQEALLLADVIHQKHSKQDEQMAPIQRYPPQPRRDAVGAMPRLSVQDGFQG